MQVSRRLALLFFCLAALIFSVVLFVPVARAAGTQLTISGKTMGQVGSTFHLDAAGFTPDGNYALYATTDAAKCTVGDPGALGLQAFTPNSITISGGAFTQDLTWPQAISQTGAYFLCTVDSILLSGPKTVSSNTFTVTPAPTLDSAPKSVIQGQSVTITGTNWLPAQTLDVSIVVGTSGAPALVENNAVQPDATGSFSITLTIPENAPARSYAIRADAVKDQTLTLTKNDSLTVTQKATPTPTPTAQPSPTPTPTIAAPTATATVNTEPGNSGNDTPSPPAGDEGNTTFNLLIFGMAGVGILFVLIGAVIFAVSTQGENG